MNAEQRAAHQAQLEEIAHNNAKGTADSPAPVDPHLMTQAGSSTSFGRRGWRRSMAWNGLYPLAPKAPDQHPTLAEQEGRDE
jgi:hypothetical protein